MEQTIDVLPKVEPIKEEKEYKKFIGLALFLGIAIFILGVCVGVIVRSLM